MSVKGRIIAVILVGCVFGGCATSASRNLDFERTQLEIREFQTRSFEVNDTSLVMKAMLNVLQDEGYIVRNADSELGFLTAAREVDVENRTSAFFATLWAGRDARWRKNTVEECSANVTQVGSRCNVRVNFQVKLLDNVGNAIRIEQVDDEDWYQDFFSKVDKSIFIEEEGI